MFPANIEAKIQRSEGCWLWTGCVVRRYGQVQYEGKRQRAHRATWKATYGAIPVGMFVLHRCDNPRCVRPEHLFLGSNLDNSRDCCSKGRHAHGERASYAKLTERDVVEIRRRYAQGSRAITAMAREFNVAFGTIGCVVYGRTWRHVPAEGSAA